MENFNYYAVIGKNGVGVFDSWRNVKNIEPYFRKITTHGFDQFHDAEAWALDMFADRFPRESRNLLYLRVNRPVYLKWLRNREV